MSLVVSGGRKISGKNAVVVAGELERIRGHRSRVTPKDVVAAATPRSSPLHRFFEWDNGAAAHRYRLAQASALIRSVQVVIQDDPKDRPRTINGWLSVVTNQGRGYVPAIEALTVPEYLDQKLAEGLRDLNVWRRKYNDVKALAPVFAAIAKATAGIRKAKAA